jgi:hypothetical protein
MNPDEQFLSLYEIYDIRNYEDSYFDVLGYDTM